MRRSIRFTRRVAATTAVLALAALCGAAQAQFPGGGRPGGGPPGGFPGGPPRGNEGLSNAPIGALAYGLKLSASQKTQIAAIQEQAHKEMRGMFPAPGGGRPDFQKMQQMMSKIQALNTQTTNKIESLLTPAQKQALPALLKDIQTLNAAGIPAELFGTLKLTAEQKNKISVIIKQEQDGMREKLQGGRQQGGFEAMRGIFQNARKQMHEKSMAALTGAQRAQVEKYLAAHPQQGPGGFGFPGGPPGGFPGGRPGGPGGPPGGPPGLLL
jgi:Spy/CpxP family protein refolding chaperone